MDFNNNNSFNHNMNSYFTPISYDSDNSDPALCRITQDNRPDWIYPTQYKPYPQSYNQNCQNHLNSS